MASLLKSKKVRLICATSLAIFSLASLFTGVGAWFLSNTKLNSATNSIKVTGTDGVSLGEGGVDIYGFDLEKDVPTCKQDDYILGNYNVFIPIRNKFCRRIIHTKIIVPGAVSDNAHLSMTFSCTGDYKSSNKILANISNLVEFKYYVNTGTIDTNTMTTSTIYTKLSSTFDAITTSDTFVSGGTKNKKFENKTAVSVKPVAKATQVIDLFIQYDYKKSLVEDYLKTVSTYNLSYFDSGTSVKFNPDITGLVFKMAGA